MRDYIILNNKNSNEIKGLLIQNLPPITKPRIRAEIDEIDGRDGDIVTPLGYGAYDKAFSIGLYGDFDINEVIKYFDSEGIVVFSNEPNKYYNYKILEQIDFEKLIRFRTADVMMHVQPFKYSTTEGKETEEMETKTASGSEIDLPDTNNEKLQMEKLKGDTHQDTIDAEEGNENEDTNLAVNDVDPSKENYITLKGNTTQYNHDSVNMLPNDMATLSLYGITITKNDDGTYTINGTTTQDFNWAINDTALNLQANTNYFLSGCATGGDAETYCLYISAYADTGNGVLINSSRAINDQVRIFIASGQTFNNAIFKPMLIEGTEAIPFEPYGMTTPSPQYPSEVKVVTGENVVSVSGKNLIDDYDLTNRWHIASVSDNLLTTTATSSDWDTFQPITRNQTISLVQGTEYYVSFDMRLKSGTYSGRVGRALIIDIDGNGLATNERAVSQPTMTSSFQRMVFKQTANTTTDIRIGLMIQLQHGANNAVFEIKNIMISTSNETTYISFKTPQIYPINIGNLELCKIGDYKDYLFKRNGKWFKHKEINKVVLDDSNIDLVVQYGTEYDYPRVLIEKVKLGWKVSWTQHIALLNNYKEITKVVEVNSGKFSGNFSSTSLTIWNSDFTSLEVAKNLLKGTIIYIALATPTEEEITDTSLITQLDALHTAELQETSYINSTPAKEYPYINLKYNVVTPAPSPDRASEINKVTGNNVVSVSGKNLFDVSKLENASWNYPNAPTRLVMFLDKANQGTKMSVTNLDTTTYRFSVGFAKLGYASQSNTIVNESGWTTNSTYTITANNDGYPFLQISRLDNANVSASEVEDKFQLEYSDTASEYTPFSKTDYPINLGDIELCKINTYKDYFHKDSGKWYVHKEIGKVVFNGSENFTIYSSNTSRVVFLINISGDIVNYVDTTKAPNLICSHFVAVSQNKTWANGDISRHTANQKGIYFTTKADETIDTFKNWLSSNNVSVYYQLATPTEEEITDETLLAQLEALDNIYNQKGTTYIKTNPEVNNMPLSLDVSYTESRPITITNSGNIYSKPIFTIYGEGDIGVYLNDIQLFNINLGSEEQITIDVAEMQAYNKETKALKNRLVTGSYDKFLLKIGENKISFSGIVKKFEIENYSRWI